MSLALSLFLGFFGYLFLLFCVTVVVVSAAAVLVGFAALVLDVASWLAEFCFNQLSRIV